MSKVWMLALFLIVCPSSAGPQQCWDEVALYDCATKEIILIR